MKRMLVPLAVLLMSGMVGAVGTPRGTKKASKNPIERVKASARSDAALTVAAAADERRPKSKPTRAGALKAKHKVSLDPDRDGIKPGGDVWMSRAPIKDKAHAAAVIKSPRAHSPAKERSDSSVSASSASGGSARSRASSPGKSPRAKDLSGAVDAAAMETADRADLTKQGV